MGKIPILWMAAVFGFWLVLPNGFAEGRPVFHSYAKPTSPPDFQIEGLQSQKVNFKNPTGEVVLVHFWATWCPACKEEVPSFEKLFSQHGTKGLKIYMVNSKEGAKTINKHLEKEPISLPILLDTTGKLGKLFGLWVLPTTYIINRKGLVVYRAIGETDWTGPEASSVINALIEEK